MVVVVKVGGRVLASNINGVVSSIARFSSSGGRVILVHGGGDEVTRVSRLMGIEPRFVVSPSGVKSRYTTWEELQVYLMVMGGLINKTLTAKLLASGVHAIGLSGVDGGIVRAERKKKILIIDERGRKRVIEGGYTGRITSVDVSTLERLLNEFEVIVMAPIALGSDGVPLNVDGDQMASRIASALRAERLILLTDVEGVYIGDRLVEELDPNEAESLAQKVGPGMNRKLLMAAQAVKDGVGMAVIASGLVDDPLGQAMRGRGTRVAPLNT